MGGTGVGLVVLTMLPSIGARCVMLNVPASWWVSETVGVVRSREAPASMLSPSSMVMSWMPTSDWISVVPVISASGDSSDGILSPLSSSTSTVEFWCLIEGLLRAGRAVPMAGAGRTVGERS